MGSHMLRRLADTLSARAHGSFISVSSYSGISGSALLSLPSRRNAASVASQEPESESVVFPREGPGFLYGLNWALAGKGVIVKDRAFQNLKPCELRDRGGAALPFRNSEEALPGGIRICFRGDVGMTRTQYSKLLKQVTQHISSVPDIYVNDGVLGSFSKSNARVRVISDCPSPALSFADLLWPTTSRSISHDPSPLTVYVATLITRDAEDHRDHGFIAGDVDGSSLILIGDAFAHTNAVKSALTTLSARIVSARGALALPAATLLLCGERVVLVLGRGDLPKSISSHDAGVVAVAGGVVVSSQGTTPAFRTGNCSASVFQLPSLVALIASDGSGAIPRVSRLSSGQAAFHFLAGYQDGKFRHSHAAESGSPSLQLDLSKALHHLLEEKQIESILINDIDGEGKRMTGEQVMEAARRALTADPPPPFQPDRGGAARQELGRTMERHLLARFSQLPEGFSF